MEKDMRFEMMKVLKGRQDKFIYYIAGLNVAAIGFTLSKTYDFVPSQGRDVLLGVALLSWFLSTMYSFGWIITQFNTMERNLEIRDFSKGYFDKANISDEQKKSLIETNKQRLKEDGERSSKRMKGTVMLFLLGIVAFTFWRAMVMFQSSL